VCLLAFSGFLIRSKPHALASSPQMSALARIHRSSISFIVFDRDILPRAASAIRRVYTGVIVKYY
jgi:hypothetical protein